MGVSSAIAFILSAIALARYVDRLPDDLVGVVLYSITLVLFAILAFGSYIVWRKERT
jgi:uncharacterized membrane protein YhhN